MRIAFDNQIFFGQAYGGVTRYYLDLLLGLQALPAPRPELRICAGLHHSDPLLELLQTQPEAPVRGWKLPTHQLTWCRKVITPSLLRRLSNVICGAQLRRFQPDIIHETYYRPHPQVPQLARGRRVITIFDMIHELFLPDQVKVIRAKAAALARADAIIVCSHSTRADLLNMFPQVADRTHLIPLCGPEIQPLLLAPVDVQTGQPLAPRPYLLYVGRRGLYKNFLFFLQAFAQVHQQTQVELLCYGGGEFKPDEAAEISRLGLSTSVRQIPGCTELWPLYQHAQAFVYPSRHEGFGIPLLEAMANRCPVVCSNTSAFPEVADVAAEYFEPDQIDTMVTAILRVITNPRRQAELRTLGEQRCALFSCMQMAVASLSLYNSLI